MNSSISTWQKFQGVWLGGVVATVRQKEKGRKYSEDWLLERRTMAAQVVKNPRLNIISLAGFEQFLSIADEDNVEQDSVTTPNQQKFARHENIILGLLPLSIFSDINQELLRELLNECVLKSLVTLEEQEDILIWSHLLYLSFNHKFASQAANVDQIIRQVLNGVKIEKSALPNKLEIVIRAWEQGLSLYQLVEELNEAGNPSQIAIALAAYCFSATPRHFELAVKRAENVSLSKSWLTITLTATLSGAYNGVAGIPWNWRARAKKQQIYQSESQLAAQLYEAWLGIYSPESFLGSYSQKYDAVAQARAIQTRQALKIISQNNT